MANPMTNDDCLLKAANQVSITNLCPMNGGMGARQFC
jgi:hypothetical protein